ncbi:MAG: hypothetical protein M3138_01505 [Actinomycetota bacterium]|nr:hypothetical protein [Actinomycetota bacterium]
MEDARRPGRVVLVLGVLLVIVAATGIFSARRGLQVEKDEAISIAQEALDFEPTRTTIRLVRQGIGGTAVWAVSFSIPTAGGSFERLTTVVVHAGTGEIIEVNRDT